MRTDSDPKQITKLYEEYVGKKEALDVKLKELVDKREKTKRRVSVLP